MVAVSRRLLPAVVLTLAAWALPVSAQVTQDAGGAQPLKAFRVCQDPNNLPFSNEKGEGIENRIAELFAGQLKVPVQYYSFPQRMAFVRNTLRYKLPGEDFRCDVILGVPAGWGQASATKPYYRSTYALIFRKGKELDGVTSGGEFLSKVQGASTKPKIGLYDKSPGSAWLAKHGLEDAAVVYPILNPDPEQFPGEIIAKDLAKGDIDVALVWGPIAGYYATHVQGAEFNVVPLKSEPGVRFDFAIAMGVRYGEPAWKAQIEKLIDTNQDAIHTILGEYGVPLVDEQGELLK
jgi:quinoprotein dehydrogenase-associated probable ABC transporter substrate-binding protein